MNAGGGQPLLVWAIVVINVAVLVVLLVGPNSAHPNAPLMRGGLAAVGIGLVLLFLAALRARRRRPPL